MTNEELARLIQSGQRDRLMELWANVQRLTWKTARRWALALDGRGGLTAEDLVQVGFLALLAALETWQEGLGCLFLSWYALALKRAFTEAAGLRTERTRRDPLRDALSLDAPADPCDPDSSPLVDLLPDPAAAEALEDVARRDRAERLHNALEWALRQLPEAQRAAVVSKYYQGQTTDRAALNAAMRALRNPAISRPLRAFR